MDGGGRGRTIESVEDKGVKKIELSGISISKMPIMCQMLCWLC